MNELTEWLENFNLHLSDLVSHISFFVSTPIEGHLDKKQAPGNIEVIECESLLSDSINFSISTFNF